MNRWTLGLAMLGLCAAVSTADAQVYVYRGPSAVYVPRAAYAAPIVVAPRPVTSAYYATPAYVSPGYVSAPAIVQMNYDAPAMVPARSVLVPAYGGVVRQTVRGGPLNYTQVTRAYGAFDGPQYSRVHVHRGLFGTTVRERVR